jgi:UDP-N-acetyl-D-mannosaminuronic acid dehydrogenase
VLRGLGATPCGIEEGFTGSDAVLVITDHPDYARLDVEKLVKRLRRPALVFDCWRILGEERVRSVPSVRYAGIGYG